MFVSVNGQVISAQDVIKSTIRTDCAPVPVTIELLIRYTQQNELSLKKGAILTTSQNYTFEIVESHKKVIQKIQDDTQYGVLSVTGIHSGCINLCTLKNSAIFLRNTSLSAVYKACGATAKTGTNFSIPEFSCLIGELATEKIAQICQEEGGAVFFRNGRIEFLRLEDIFTQKPVISLRDDVIEKEDTDFLQPHLVSSFFSTRVDGGLAKGDFKTPRKRDFIARTPERILFNLSKCLIRKRIVPISYNPNINAGDCIEVNGVNMAIMTAAHVYENDNGQDIKQYTRLWLGVLQK